MGVGLALKGERYACDALVMKPALTQWAVHVGREQVRASRQRAPSASSRHMKSFGLSGPLKTGTPHVAIAHHRFDRCVAEGTFAPNWR